MIRCTNQWQPSVAEMGAINYHRYSRQILLPELGVSGQEKISKSKVLVIGSGGLGSPILLYLAAAGVGTIGITDFDVVDESNLQRQILFTTHDIGKPKAVLASEKLRALNPAIQLRVFNEYLSSKNALEIISDFDLVVDGSDNLPTRYLVNDACVLLEKTLVYGAIFQFEGQVSVFNQLNADGSKGPNYRDLFPSPPPPEMVPSCNEGGVLGVLPGIIGSMMATETIKLIAGIGSTLSGRLLLFDALDFSTRYVKIKPNPDSPKIVKLIDYEEFCNPSHSLERINQIEPSEAKNLINNNGINIIDVREPFEFEASNIGGINIPLSEVERRIAEIPTSQKTIVVCKSGGRSSKAILKLQSLGFQNLYNLKGGLLQWAAQVDKKFTPL